MLPKASAKSMKTDVNLEAIKCSFKEIIDSCRPLYSKKKQKKQTNKKIIYQRSILFEIIGIILLQMSSDNTL